METISVTKETVININCVCKDHSDKIRVPDPVVKDLISKHTLKKKGRAFRNIEKIYFPYLEISLALFQITFTVTKSFSFVNK